MTFSLCSTRTLWVLFISAVPVAIIIPLERAEPATKVYHYHSTGFFRECAKWDDSNRRFLISYLEGGIGQVSVPDDYSPGTVLEELTLVKDVDLAGNMSAGIVVDRPRNRLLVAVAQLFGNMYSGLAAYDLSTWNRLFLTHLSGANDEKSMAEDVAVDGEGNAYVTDDRSNKIWKVGVDGQLLSVIKSPLFTPKEWYKNWFGLNGIVYHPGGFLIVMHKTAGNLLKIDIAKGDEVKLIEVSGGALAHGDGIELLSPTKLVVTAGIPTARLVESSDGWRTASVVAEFNGPAYRWATAATVKDGKVFINHMVGMGYPKKKHAFVEAVF